jgi:hypothetical protein
MKNSQHDRIRKAFDVAREQPVDPVRQRPKPKPVSHRSFLMVDSTKVSLADQAAPIVAQANKSFKQFRYMNRNGQFIVTEPKESCEELYKQCVQVVDALVRRKEKQERRDAE